MTDVSLAPAAWEGVDASVQALVDKWLVQPGQTVTPGQPLANVVLVKSSLEVTAPASGRVAQIHVPAGATFARGTVLATLE
jgi:pyruvate/2-oxoglutarate dehydrogenase complex dihydrolipoamide acyltransferase (E2) component